jgi:hypothetical protein
MNIHAHRRFFQSAKRGTAIVLIALAMVALIGFMALGIDFSMMNFYGQRMQNAFDGAALAGAAELKVNANDDTNVTNAKAKAVLTAAQHGITIATTDVTVFSSNQRIRVEKTITYPALFAPILGRNTLTLYRKATAEKTGIAAIPQMTPLALNPADIGANGSTHTVTLARNQSQDFGPGGALAINLSGSPSKSVSEFENEFKYGTTHSPSVGEDYVSLDASTGQQSAFEDGLNYRLSTGNTIIFVPLVNSTADGNGNIWHEIIGFQAIQITGTSTSGGNGSNKRVSVSYTTRNDITFNSESTGITYAANGATTNLYIIRLIDDLS